MTRFPSTTSNAPEDLNRPSAVSTGRSKIEDFRDHERLRLSDDIVSLDCRSPRFSKPQDKILIAAFPSLSISNPQAGHECSRTQSGLSDSTPHEAHSMVVPAGSTSTKRMPSRLQLYSSTVVNVSQLLKPCSDHSLLTPASTSHSSPRQPLTRTQSRDSSRICAGSRVAPA